LHEPRQWRELCTEVFGMIASQSSGIPSIGGDPHPGSFRMHHSLGEASSDGRCVACHR